jgi:hypothetical protein
VSFKFDVLVINIITDFDRGIDGSHFNPFNRVDDVSWHVYVRRGKNGKEIHLDIN